MKDKRKASGSASFDPKRSPYWYMYARYTDRDGKPRRTSKSTGIPGPGNKRQAQARLKEYLAELERDAGVPGELDAKTTVAELLRYHLASTEGRLKKNTWEKNEYICGIVTREWPQSEKILVKNLKRSDVKHLFFDILMDRRGLKAATVREYRLYLIAALDTAIDAEIIVANIARSVAIKTPAGERKKEIRVMDGPELQDFLGWLKEKDKAMYYIALDAATNAFRRGEIVGLRWKNVDLDNRRIRIAETTTSNKSIHYGETTKTEESDALVAISEAHVALFQQIKAEQNENRRYYADMYIESGYVHTWPDGRPFRPDYVTKRICRLLADYGRDDMSLHDLRKSCLSLHLTNGVDLLVVQKIARHKSARTTLSFYLAAKPPDDHIDTGLRF